MGYSALVVEDNVDLRSILTTHLREAEFDVSEFGEVQHTVPCIDREAFDVAILDITLPDGSGLDICRRLRQYSHYTPIIILSAKESEADKILGLNVGADDYVTKPFSITELVARVNAQVRRSNFQPLEPDIFVSNELRIDTNTRIVTLNNHPVNLTALEFDLLTWFASQPGRVFTRSQLLDNVWGRGYKGYEHTVNSHINRLRNKIEVDSSNPQYIKTIWGVGYAFQ